MLEDKKVLSKLNDCLQENKPVAVVTIVDVEGSTPRGVGSMMLVDEKGALLEGTIGGGILEEKAKRDAAKCIRAKTSQMVEYDLDSTGKVKGALPMICGGKTRIFIKVISQKEHLVIAGGGHIGQRLAKMAKMLDYCVTVLDYREEMLTKERYPDVDELILGDIPENLAKIPIDFSTNIVIVTHGHKFDQDALEKVINSDARYIGMIGSMNKIKITFKNLIDKGISREKISRVYSPIGLDLGGETPEEIALGILAEIQAVKNNKDVPHMKDIKNVGDF
ncbi:MAG TPA: XshC-Cox1-family protein [Thermoanaerobacterales bacterium]|jgi:xanthine dehydrogenase accessory factor|nr:XshC-Cox1-family protein [Thermoanaerobacterales bacterium]